MEHTWSKYIRSLLCLWGNCIDKEPTSLHWKTTDILRLAPLGSPCSIRKKIIEKIMWLSRRPCSLIPTSEVAEENNKKRKNISLGTACSHRVQWIKKLQDSELRPNSGILTTLMGYRSLHHVFPVGFHHCCVAPIFPFPSENMYHSYPAPFHQCKSSGGGKFIWFSFHFIGHLIKKSFR